MDDSSTINDLTMTVTKVTLQPFPRTISNRNHKIHA